MSDSEMDDYDYGYENGFSEGEARAERECHKTVVIKEDLAYEAGLKKAYDLVGELANFYRDNIDCGDDWPEEEKKAFKKELQGQVNACKYAQHVIQKGVWDEEDEDNW